MSQEKATKGVCFVISPIGEPDSPVRQHADEVLEHIIKPTMTLAGYKTVRADSISDHGVITPEIIEFILTAPMAIADLTELNPNVVYELAIRHAFHKPVIMIRKTDDKSLPFDLKDVRTIHYDKTWGGLERCKNAIREQIKSIEKDPSKVDSPIKVAAQLMELRQSDDPVAVSTEQIFSMLFEISKRLISVEESLEEKGITHSVESHYESYSGTAPWENEDSEPVPWDNADRASNYSEPPSTVDDIPF